MDAGSGRWFRWAAGEQRFEPVPEAGCGLPQPQPQQATVAAATAAV